MTPDYGQTFALWREGVAASWRAYMHHDFVEGLRDGSLPRAAFLHYLVQDYVFLVHFSRAWSLGVVKSDTLDEMKVCAETVNALVNHEMALHIKTCAAEGIEEAALYKAREEVENIAYTRYVMDAGLQGDFLDLMAALMPCVLGYGEIGARLGSQRSSGIYAEWIDTYAGAEYQQLCAHVGAMLDGAIERRLGSDPTRAARWPALMQRFEVATQLEAGFWSMGLRAD